MNTGVAHSREYFYEYEKLDRGLYHIILAVNSYSIENKYNINILFADNYLDKLSFLSFYYSNFLKSEKTGKT